MTDTNKRHNVDRVILTMVFLGYLIFNGILLVRHELWRDEANVWLMAKGCSDGSFMSCVSARNFFLLPNTILWHGCSTDLLLAP